MDIKGLDYNTKRERLIMAEYGREIQKMVDHAVALPTKEERMECARTIVRLMKTKVEGDNGGSDQERALWDHLYIMSHEQLDIDWPYDVSDVEKSLTKPQPMALPKGKPGLRHYGRLVEELWKRLSEMPEGEQRDTLACYTANQMKRDLAIWGHGTIDDEKVVDDLAHFTNGIIRLDLQNFTFEKVTPMAAEGGKRKRKK
ncbi:MAG: DUF4290 domain-containing protein [Prevotella sp.]|nr:DUF4290 domain-containing protein [Prevotella sp.]